MSTRKPREAEVYELKADHGNPGDPGLVPAGAKVTVRELVDADTLGAHDSSEASVVVEYDRHQVAEGPDGPSIITVPQAFSIGFAEFHDKFQLVKGEEGDTEGHVEDEAPVEPGTAEA